jgi:hypothetical protein
MNQKDLMCLLREASDLRCDPKRRRIIQMDLERTVVHADVREVVSKLYHQASAARPEYLVALFPFFAMVCGNKPDEELAAPIDWSLMADVV